MERGRDRAGVAGLTNPKIRPQISVQQVLLAASALLAKPEALHSSWPLDEGHELHAKYRGELKSIGGARVLALDQLVLEEKLARIDLSSSTSTAMHVQFCKWPRPSGVICKHGLYRH
jgi:hypothetical protein